ncbi:ethyl tert-butyl ether degradation protein EthD [Embleya scabrispora]|uniref:Ethyl tert-butyl ether degradation protein EthD n=1 Tax=Embleya scabrispora TaxID=159449 RepID=A0A1T3P3Y1_9ACTN|nr:EthD family reductase [Embleya scabrispora]OPC83796.1 ethyl tert-butyl ether degradation protein EthD [Embleya scabrispora]
MYKLTVLYGHPEDPAAFDSYYWEKHVPLARTMPGLTGWTIGKCEPDPSGARPPYYLVVALYAPSRAELQAVLDSPEGRATVADVPHFATGGATFLWDEERVVVPVELPATE